MQAQGITFLSLSSDISCKFPCTVAEERKKPRAKPEITKRKLQLMQNGEKGTDEGPWRRKNQD